MTKYTFRELHLLQSLNMIAVLGMFIIPPSFRSGNHCLLLFFCSPIVVQVDSAVDGHAYE